MLLTIGYVSMKQESSNPVYQEQHHRIIVRHFKMAGHVFVAVKEMFNHRNGNI